MEIGPIKFDFLATRRLGWCQDNGNGSSQESKFDFLATRQQLEKIDGQQKIKIVRTNQQPNLWASPNQFSPSASTTLVNNSSSM